MTKRLFRRHRTRGLQRWLAAGVIASLAQFAIADSDYVAAWGPGIGTMAPLLAANDQDGKLRKLDSLSGSRGLLLVFNRSVDW